MDEVEQGASKGFVPGSKRLLAAGGLGLGTFLAMGSSAQAATFTVTNLSDSGPGSLRQAIADANANPDADTITFASGLTGTINLTTVAAAYIGLEIKSPIDLQGPGAGQITVQPPAGDLLFYVHPGNAQQATISGLTLSGAATGVSGGAVYAGGADSASGRVTIANSVITGNALTGGATGGGIQVYKGALDVKNSTISNNSARYGGGIYFNDTNDSMQSTISGDTFQGNSATGGDGGAIYPNDSNAQGPIVIQNSTFTGNHAGDGVNDHGGAIYDFGNPPVLTVTGSTISGNSATDGAGGVFFEYGDTIRNSIISGNSGGAGDVTQGNGPDVGEQLSRLGVQPIKTAFDLIQNPAGPMLTETVPGSNITGADPQLGPLASNGGPTQTMAIPSTSPAFEKGSAFGLTSDQRGVLRPIDFPSIPNSTAPGADGSDIGAFELQPANAITLGALKRNKKKGTAVQTVNLPTPDAGSVTLSGKFLKTQTQAVADNGIVKLKVIAKGKVRKLLKRKGKAKTGETVTYNPTGQSPNAVTKKVKLLKKKRRHH
jgi:hypothetical protein